MINLNIAYLKIVMIIGLCGMQGSGKDTVANILINKYGFIKISFAGILKDVVSVMFDWDRELLEGVSKESRQWRETKDNWWSDKLLKEVTPRKVLQEIGTDVFRNNYESNIWVYCLENKLRKYGKGTNYVISDCRFTNEINMIKKLGGYIIQVNRNLPEWFNDIKSGKLENIEGLHSSEIEWIKANPDFTIDNEDTLEELYKKVIILLELIVD